MENGPAQVLEASKRKNANGAGGSGGGAADGDGDDDDDDDDDDEEWDAIIDRFRPLDIGGSAMPGVPTTHSQPLRPAMTSDAVIAVCSFGTFTCGLQLSPGSFQVRCLPSRRLHSCMKRP